MKDQIIGACLRGERVAPVNSKLKEKYILDLRNVFLNQENINKFSQNKKTDPAQTNFLIRQFILIYENTLRMRTFYLK